MENFSHGGGRTDKQAKGALVTQAAAERFIFDARVEDLADVGEDGAEAAEVDGLFDVVAHAETAGLEGIFGGLLGSDHDDGDGLVGEALDEFHAAHARHFDVGDDDRGREGGDLIEGLEAIDGGVSAVTPTGDELGEAGALVLFVFDD